MHRTKLTAATATVFSRQKPEEAMSGRCQKYWDGTHLQKKGEDIRVVQYNKGLFSLCINETGRGREIAENKIVYEESAEERAIYASDSVRHLQMSRM